MLKYYNNVLELKEMNDKSPFDSEGENKMTETIFFEK